MKPLVAIVSYVESMPFIFIRTYYVRILLNIILMRSKHMGKLLTLTIKEIQNLSALLMILKFLDYLKKTLNKVYV